MRTASTTLILVRHGETEWNATHRWQGFRGLPLNERGLRQAQELSQKLAATHIDAVYSSDSTRATQTAEIVARPHGLAVLEDARLREVNFGEWEGLTREEIDERYAGGCREWEACRLPAPTGGETDFQMAERVLQVLREIAIGHAGERVLVVTSGGPMIAVQAHADGIDQGTARLHVERAGNCEVHEHEVHAEDAAFAVARTR